MNKTLDYLFAVETGEEKGEQKVKEYIEALQGITFEEWIKLRTAIDRRFDQKIGEFKKELKLSESKIVEDIIHSRFGCRLD